MAKKRMFSVDIVETDRFYSLPATARDLYFHLCMNADDDGFLQTPKRIKQCCGASDDDLSILILKSYCIPFDDGIIVIADWNINNTLKNDRYKNTIFQEHYRALTLKNKKYIPLTDTMDPNWNQIVSKKNPNWNQNGNILELQDRRGEDREEDKNILDNNIVEMIDEMLIKDIETMKCANNETVVNNALSNVYKVMSNYQELVRKDYKWLIVLIFNEAVDIENGIKKNVFSKVGYLIGVVERQINEYDVVKRQKEKIKNGQNTFY